MRWDGDEDIPRPDGRTLAVLDLGRTRYREALERQLELVQARKRGDIGDTLALTEHEPVVTVGRSARGGDGLDVSALARHGIELLEASRGGAVTYHGPGQLIGYPIIALRERGGDLHGYLEALEQALISAVRGLGASARSRPGLRGVWVADRKIASIGVAVRGWITYHGFALNVDCDLKPFELIAPCGLEGVEMTSLARELGGTVGWDAVREAVVEAFVAQFRFAGWELKPVGKAVGAVSDRDAANSASTNTREAVHA